MHIAIIGCGASGLASIQRAIHHNVECTAFEMSDSIGGMWQYREETDLGDLGNPMYYSLRWIRVYIFFNIIMIRYLRIPWILVIWNILDRTNLPVPLMEFGDFKFEPKSGSSFPHHTEVMEYLDAFAERYDLYSRIKVSSYILRYCVSSQNTLGWNSHSVILRHI